MIIQTIKKRSDFIKISKKNTSFYSKTTLILTSSTLQNDLRQLNRDFIRIGYTVTKKTGNAVFRNKCKRRYRAIFKEFAPEFCQNHFDYIILARKEIKNADFKKIRSDVKFCLRGIQRLLKENGK
jgi:ribonuclease P protein component